MTPEQTAAASRPLVAELGGTRTDVPVTRLSRQFGISGWACYVALRAGALGDVGSATVAACLGLVAPDAVAEGWDAASRVVSPREVALAGLADYCRRGRDLLADIPDPTRLAELLHRAVNAAEASGLPLFAAWRALPVPDDSPAGRAAAGLYLLWELHQGAYLVAVRAAGMTPVEAVLAGPEGEAGAMAVGWPRPYPPVGPLIRRRLWAEAASDRLVAPAFRVLEPVERVELVDLLTTVRHRARDTAAPPAD